MRVRLGNPTRFVAEKVRATLQEGVEDDVVGSFLRDNDIDPGFCALFDPDFFVARHLDCARTVDVADLLDAVAKRVAAGAFAIAPGYDFDARFYRAICFDHAIADDRQAFRHFLSIGLRYNIAPNKRVFLGRLGIDEDLDTDLAPPPDADAPTYWHFLDAATRPDNRASLLDVPAASVDPRLFFCVGKRLAADGDFALSSLFLSRYADLRGLTTPEKQLKADVAFNLGDLETAALLYGEVLAGREGNMWTRINLARALTGMELFGPAYDILTEVRDQFLSDEMFVRYFDHVCEAHLDWARGEYRRRAAASEEGYADVAALEDACARVDSALRRFYQHVPLARPHAGKRSVAIVANRDLPQCWFYRVEQKRLYLARAGVDVVVYDVEDIGDLVAAADRHDAVIVHRLGYSVRLAKAVHYLRAQGVALLYDVDDLIFDIAHYPGPLDDWCGAIPADVHLDLAGGTALFKAAIALFQTVVVSTDELAELVSELFPGRTVHVFRNGIDERFDPFVMGGNGRTPRPGEPFTLTYGTGSHAQRPDWHLVAEPALFAVMERFAHVHLVFVGPFAPAALLERFPGRVAHYAFCDLDEYWSVLSRSDATLSVLRPLPRNAAKSELKWTEAAFFGVPAVVCGGGAIIRATEHGRTALQAHTSDEIVAAVSALVTDAGLRRALRTEAFAQAVRRYGADEQSRALAALLAGVPQPRIVDPRPVIMVCNVFFWPEMVGGATRIVKEEVDDLLDRLGDEFRVVVVCGSGRTGAFAPHTLTYGYRDACVHQICYPQYADMDWHYENEAHGELFARIIEAERPQVIHFHAVQRLTASVVGAAARAGVPYVVTVHDGWWIADDMFFRAGEDIAVPVSPWVDGVHETPASVRRRTVLERHLRGAAEVVVVSAQFRDIYASVVDAPYRVIANGVDLAPPPPRRRAGGPAGPVLGFIGGLSSHKGYGLVKLVFHLHAFRRLRLLLVDHSMMAGDRRFESWGGNRVEFIGRVDQAEVGQLYDRLDYLLAPSLWPESFGLVSREATLAGVYVIASDRGAMGDDIEDGVTGSRVSVDSHRPLLDLLVAIDEGRFAPALPVPPAILRSSHRQTQEVRACLMRHLAAGSTQDALSA